MSEAAGDGSAHGPAVTAQSSNLAPEDTDVGLEGPSRLPALVPSVVDELAGMGCQSDLSAGLSCECCGLEALAPGSRSSNDSSGRAEPRARCGCSPSAQIVRQERLSRTEEVSAVVLLVPTSGSVQASIIVESEPLEEDDQCLIHSPRLHNHMHRDPRHPASHGLFGRTAHGAAAGADHMDLKERQAAALQQFMECASPPVAPEGVALRRYHKDGSLRYSTPPYSIDMEGRPTSALDADEENKYDTPSATTHTLRNQHSLRVHTSPPRDAQMAGGSWPHRDALHPRGSSSPRRATHSRPSSSSRHVPHPPDCQQSRISVQAQPSLRPDGSSQPRPSIRPDGRMQPRPSLRPDGSLRAGGSSKALSLRVGGGEQSFRPLGRREVTAAIKIQMHARRRHAVREVRKLKLEMKRQELEHTRDESARLIIRAYRAMVRKREARIMRKREHERQAQAASKIQLRARLKRISRFVGYTGEERDGQGHGEGRMVWQNGSSYDGGWVTGEPDGEGEMIWSDGSCYYGQWTAGQRQGYGVYENKAGDVYTGEWSFDAPNGSGSLLLSNGSLKSGMWKSGKPHGHMKEVIRSADGSEWVSEFIGEFLHGERHGPGRELTEAGEYDGMWKDGLRHGVGRFESSMGWVYRGGWVEGMRHGKGTLTSPFGHRFVGTWERDKLPEGEFCGRYFGEYVGTFRALSDDEDWPFVRHGHGVWKGREGETYDGEWVDDYFHGIGKMKTQSIDYEGGFQRSKRHGKGKLFYADGSWYEGEFKDDMFDGIGELHDSNGVYEGWFRKGLRNGHGIYRSIECVTYTGNWKDGVRHGKGKLLHPDGSRYEGLWESDKPGGEGTYVAPDGTSYRGEYFKGLRHGEAEWTGLKFKYDGTFKQGGMGGEGKFTWDDGGVFMGTWRAPHPEKAMRKEMVELKGQQATPTARQDIDIRPASVSKFVKSFRESLRTAGLDSDNPFQPPSASRMTSLNSCQSIHSQGDSTSSMRKESVRLSVTDRRDIAMAALSRAKLGHVLNTNLAGLHKPV